MTYQGTVNTTRKGKDCQMWSSYRPYADDYGWLGFHNFCRNPQTGGRYTTNVKTSGTGAWCYTTVSGTEWDYCDIRDCTPCDEGNEQYH